MRIGEYEVLIRKVYLSAGNENVQAAQKYITGLDARRISKQSDLRCILLPLQFLKLVSCSINLLNTTCMSLLSK